MIINPMRAGIIKGCWQYSGGHGAVSHDPIHDLMLFADAGITTFDCADIYTGVEETLGAFRSEYARRRGRVALAGLRFHTKFVPDLDVLAHINREYVERIIDRSLRRLEMERLDLVQFHWWDFAIPGHVETIGMLADLQRAGKIRHIGVTNYDVAHLREIIESGVTVVSNQVQYSVLDDRPEHGMTAYCRKNAIGLLCYGTVAGGFLAETFLDVPEPTGELTNRSLTKYKYIIDDWGGWGLFQELLHALDRVAHSHGVSISEVAIAYIRMQEAVTGVILGMSARRIDMLEQIARVSLTPQDHHTISEVLEQAHALPGDVYELERRPGKHSAIMRYNLNA